LQPDQSAVGVIDLMKGAPPVAGAPFCCFVMAACLNGKDLIFAAAGNYINNRIQGAIR